MFCGRGHGGDMRKEEDYFRDGFYNSGEGWWGRGARFDIQDFCMLLLYWAKRGCCIVDLIWESLLVLSSRLCWILSKSP